MDYGAPVDFRFAVKNPDRVSAFVIQNGNAYDEGIEKFWDPIKTNWTTTSADAGEGIRWLMTIKATYWQYHNGVKDTPILDPDS